MVRNIDAFESLQALQSIQLRRFKSGCPEHSRMCGYSAACKHREDQEFFAQPHPLLSLRYVLCQRFPKSEKKMSAREALVSVSRINLSLLYYRSTGRALITPYGAT